MSFVVTGSGDLLEGDRDLSGMAAAEAAAACLCFCCSEAARLTNLVVGVGMGAAALVARDVWVV